MLSPVTMKQFERLQQRYPLAHIERLGSGAALVTIPDFPVPKGWNAATTCLRFLVPAGYPGPNPDCFYASRELRLANGAVPQAANEQQIPETSHHALWFSWHVVGPQQNWNPNLHDLMTWVSIISDRFVKAQ